ncbi:hypothetical protein G647_02204 [Cladophialophora carrionii CBS 160.54]|uniref:BZIP domain-containing protein n=1 Tax=Cladophialophora carrionii CBS 160.54 TaxID=1279043 RepID=V9DFK3_9EURO|nr:uncharacterized protein G647_02204 [Cladophialophora carrionii CBS 160.54]ETI25431.1 hypothetical protein G647_02204 [Cladophialophora carrionii CBS 160.54]
MVTRVRTTEQNRINQRNLRARRKAYVQELEQRVRKLENERIGATKEVQVAAQRVHNENRLLRWLLETKFGVDAYQINNYLSEVNSTTGIGTQLFHNPGNNVAVPTPAEQLACGPVSTTSPAEAFRARATHDSDIAETTSEPREKKGSKCSPELSDHERRSPTTSSTSAEAQPPVQVESPTRFSSNQYLTPQQTPPPTGLQQGDHRCETSLGHSSCVTLVSKDSQGPCVSSKKDTDAHAEETSCEEAARIIASLRGHVTPDEVWNELGCGTTQACRVKNLAVFELMDKEPAYVRI